MEHPSGPAHRSVVTWQGLLLIASLLIFWSPPITAQQNFDIPVESVPPIAAEGKEVLLLARKLPEKFSRLDWFRGEILPINNIVSLRPNPENITNGPAHSGRETIYSNGSLLIQNLIVGDKGIYRIQVITESNDLKYGYGELRLYELLSKPIITANNLSPVEQEVSVVLTCETKSPNTTYRWFINTQPFQPSAKLQLSPDNRNLTVHNITRNDTGPYECEISNPVSVNRSDLFILTVLYGPDDPTISPSKPNYPQGGNLSLSCHTASNPPANFSWFMSEKLLGSTQTLSITNLSLSHSGSYSCHVSNSATNLNRSMSINITVLEPVAQPSIQASNTTVTEGAGPVVLTCLMNDTRVSTRWYLNYEDLQPAERRKLSENNKTLTLNPVLRIDEGDYQCEVYNPVSFLKSDSIRLQVTPTPGLSAGAIAGIVIGVLAGAALIAALVYFLYVRKTGGSGPL